MDAIVRHFSSQSQKGCWAGLIGRNAVNSGGDTSKQNTKIVRNSFYKDYQIVGQGSEFRLEGKAARRE